MAGPLAPLTPITHALSRWQAITLGANTALLALAIVATPIMSAHSIVAAATISGAAITAIAVIGTSPTWFLIAATLGALKIAQIWSVPLTEQQPNVWASAPDPLLLGDLLLLLLIAKVMHIVYQPSRSIRIRLTGAVAGYLMGIVLFANLYAWALGSVPDAIDGIYILTDENPLANIMYFSVVTQTTLGYGDMHPAAPITRSLAMAQAILGVLYVAVIIAGLIGTTAKRDD